MARWPISNWSVGINYQLHSDSIRPFVRDFTCEPPSVPASDKWPFRSAFARLWHCARTWRAIDITTLSKCLLTKGPCLANSAGQRQSTAGHGFSATHTPAKLSPATSGQFTCHVLSIDSLACRCLSLNTYADSCDTRTDGSVYCKTCLTWRHEAGEAGCQRALARVLHVCAADRLMQWYSGPGKRSVGGSTDVHVLPWAHGKTGKR